MSYPSPNEKKGERIDVALFLMLIFVICSIFFLIVWGITSLSTTKVPDYKTHDSLTINYTYDGEEIRTYVMIDPDTNIQYLVNDRGGMVRREFD